MATRLFRLMLGLALCGSLAAVLNLKETAGRDVSTDARSACLVDGPGDDGPAGDPSGGWTLHAGAISPDSIGVASLLVPPPEAAVPLRSPRGASPSRAPPV